MHPSHYPYENISGGPVVRVRRARRCEHIGLILRTTLQLPGPLHRVTACDGGGEPRHSGSKFLGA